MARRRSGWTTAVMTWFQGRPPDQSTNASWSTLDANVISKLVGTI